MHDLRIIGLRGLPEIKSGDNLASLIVGAVQDERVDVDQGDVFVVTQKIVSKAAGRTVRLSEVEPSAVARQWASVAGKDPRLVEVILRESVRVVRMDRGVIIAETKHGLVCANAGVDTSNVTDGLVALLPDNPDLEAQRLRDSLSLAWRRRVGVIISDTFGRPWRLGQVNVAVGASGVKPLLDYRGLRDQAGQALHSTVIATADELASAAELVMGKIRNVPVAIIKGAAALAGEGAGADLIRPADEDMFR